MWPEMIDIIIVCLLFLLIITSIILHEIDIDVFYVNMVTNILFTLSIVTYVLKKKGWIK